MRRDYERLFSHLEPPEPPAGLFDRILLAVKREQELRDTKRLIFGFLILLIISVSSVPFSWSFFSDQIAELGILQFTSVAINDFGTFPALRPDFVLAITESLPITGIILFALNIIIAVFTLRLFLYRKRLLLEYFLRGMSSI